MKSLIRRGDVPLCGPLRATQGYALSSPTSIDLRADISTQTTDVRKLWITGRNLCRQPVSDLIRLTRGSLPAPSATFVATVPQSIQQHGSGFSYRQVTHVREILW